MKILYVTGMAGPIKDILSGKKEDEITNSPGFFHPWYKLVKRGHRVDFVLASNFNQEPDIRVDWFSADNIYANIYDPYLEAPWYGRLFRRVKRFIKLIYYTNKSLTENSYDFVYCKAFYEGLAGNIVANIHGVPCGMRSMGTMLYHDFQRHGVIRTAIKRPAEFLTFKLKKEFFIMTDDGTKGDLVYEKWKPRKKKYDYYFWKTGVATKEIGTIESRVELPKHEYIFFAARFDHWKRHDRILKILYNLHCRKLYVHLYFAGGIQSQSYYREIKELVHKYDLADYVHFLGPVKQDDLKLYAYHAVANPLMYDISNLGNVFFEIFSVGSVVIGLNDGSLNDYLIHEENGFVVNNESEASVIVEKLLRNKEITHRIRENAASCARRKFLSLDARFDMEVDLIEQTVASKKCSGPRNIGQ